MTAPYKHIAAIATLTFLPGMFFAAPSVFPTGTTIYHPDKAWSGYTLHDTPDEQGAVLVDMNGTVVKLDECRRCAESISPATRRVCHGWKDTAAATSGSDQSRAS